MASTGELFLVWSGLSNVSADAWANLIGGAIVALLAAWLGAYHGAKYAAEAAEDRQRTREQEREEQRQRRFQELLTILRPLITRYTEGAESVARWCENPTYTHPYLATDFSTAKWEAIRSEFFEVCSDADFSTEVARLFEEVENLRRVNQERIALVEEYRSVEDQDPPPSLDVVLDQAQAASERVQSKGQQLLENPRLGSSIDDDAP